MRSPMRLRRHHRTPPMPRTPPDGHCQWCGEAIRYPEGHKRAGELNVRRRWHPECVQDYLIARGGSIQRRAVWRRDKGVCASCGRECPDSQWEVDHIRPLWQSPQDMPLTERAAWFGMANLQTLCRRCHQVKTAREAAERAGKPRLDLEPA